MAVPSWLLPKPTEIVMGAIEWTPDLVTNSLVTLRETVFGFLLALALSLPPPTVPHASVSTRSFASGKRSGRTSTRCRYGSVV